MEKNIKFEQNTPLWDNSLSIEERLDYLTGAMTLEEKIHCLTTGCPDIPRLGIRATYMGGEAALYGAVWAGASVIWEMDDWSLLRQTVTHLLAGSIATFPVAYLMYWMKHSIAGVVVYFAIFIGIYVGIWITLYSRAKREVTKLNEKVSLQNR